MDFVFWVPWFMSLVIFVLWIKKPITEFKKLWDEQHARHNDSARDNQT